MILFDAILLGEYLNINLEASDKWNEDIDAHNVCLALNNF